MNLPTADERRLPVDHKVTVVAPVKGFGRLGRGSREDAIGSTEGGCGGEKTGCRKKRRDLNIAHRFNLKNGFVELYLDRRFS